MEKYIKPPNEAKGTNFNDVGILFLGMTKCFKLFLEFVAWLNNSKTLRGELTVGKNRLAKKLFLLDILLLDENVSTLDFPFLDLRFLKSVMG